VVDRWIVFPFELIEVNRLRVESGEVSAAKAPTLRANLHPPNV